MTAPALPKRATFLARISDARDSLDENGHRVTDTEGIELQIKNGLKFASRIGWVIDKIRVENDVSAFKRKKIMLPDGRYVLRTVRPEFRETLDDLASGAQDGLLVSDIDRAMRDMRDLEDLVDVVAAGEPRVPVAAVSGSLQLGNDGEETVSRILVAIANKSSKDTRRRVIDRRKEQAQTGRYGGGKRPFGFGAPTGVLNRGRPVVDVTQRVDSEAAEIINAANAILTGTSLRELVADLRARGVPTASGAPWTSVSLRAILLRPRNAGLTAYKGEIIEGVSLVGVDDDHPPILDRGTWEAVRAILLSADRRTTPGPAPRWLGTNIYRCGHPECVDRDDTPTLRMGTSAGKGRVKSYGCQRLSHLARVAEHLDKFVTVTVVRRLVLPDAVKLLEAKQQVDTAALQTEATALRSRIRTLGDLVEDGSMGRAEYKVRRNRLEASVAEITAKLRSAASRDPLVGLAGNPDAKAIWENELTLAQQRAIVANLLTVSVLPIRAGQGRSSSWVRGQTYFNPDTVRTEFNR